MYMGLGTVRANSVKTVEDSLEEFFSLFTDEQIKILKEKVII